MEQPLKALIATAKSYYERRDFVQARGYLEDIILAHTGFADVYHMLGVIYHDLGLFSKAQQAFEQALKINPRYTEAALNLAILCNDLGHYHSARQFYDMAQNTSQPDEANNHSGAFHPVIAGKIANMHAEVAEAYRAAGDHTAAVQEFAKALQLCPQFVDIRQQLAKTYMENRQYAEAMSEWQQILNSQHLAMQARVQLGVCYLALGQTDLAVSHWQRVRTAYPDDLHAAMYLRMVQDNPQAQANATTPCIN